METTEEGKAERRSFFFFTEVHFKSSELLNRKSQTQNACFVKLNNSELVDFMTCLGQAKI